MHNYIRENGCNDRNDISYEEVLTPN